MDLRLVAPALVVWVTTALCLGFSVFQALIVAAVSGAIAASAVGASRVFGQRWAGPFRWEVLGPVVVCAMLAATCALAMALRLETRERHPLYERDGKVTVGATVRSDPVNLGPSAGGQIRIDVDVNVVGRREVRAARVEVSGRRADWSELVPGQRVRVLVALRAARPGTLDVARASASRAPELVGRAPPLQRAAHAIRERLQLNSSRSLSPDSAALFPGLVLGDESAVGDELREDFRAAGLLHLTAVSGANFAIVVGAVVFVARLVGGSPRVVVICGAIAIIGFVVLVRPSPSVLRAAMMGAIGLVALMAARRSQALPALGTAVIGGLLWWPELAREPGFALSVAATAGLVLIAPSVRDRLRSWRVPSGLAEVVAMAVAAQVVTAPIIAFLSGTFSAVSVLANVVVAPVVGIVAIGGTVAALIGGCGGAGSVAPVVAGLVIRMMGPEVWWIIACARRCGSWQWAVIDVPRGWAGAVLVLVVTVCVGAAIVRWGGRRSRA